MSISRLHCCRRSFPGNLITFTATSVPCYSPLYTSPNVPSPVFSLNVISFSKIIKLFCGLLAPITGYSFIWLSTTYIHVSIQLPKHLLTSHFRAGNTHISSPLVRSIIEHSLRLAGKKIEYVLIKYAITLVSKLTLMTWTTNL